MAPISHQSVKTSIDRVRHRFSIVESNEAVSDDRIHRIVRLVDTFQNEANRKISVLEIGLACGFVTTALCDNIHNSKIKIFALEHPDIKIGDQLSELINETGVELGQCDITTAKFPYSPHLFDIVIFAEVIEHISPSLVPDILVGINRLLKRDGLLIITSPNLFSLHYRIKMIRGRSVFDPAIPVARLPNAKIYGHIRLYSPAEISDIASSCGFETTLVQYARYGLSEKNILNRSLYRLLYKIIPSLATDFIISLKPVMVHLNNTADLAKGQ